MDKLVVVVVVVEMAARLCVFEEDHLRIGLAVWLSLLWVCGVMANCEGVRQPRGWLDLAGSFTTLSTMSLRARLPRSTLVSKAVRAGVNVTSQSRDAPGSQNVWNIWVATGKSSRNFQQRFWSF